MASYTSNLKSWGSKGQEFPDGYSYAAGDQPVDAWDNFISHNTISDIQHLVSLTNSRLESDSSTIEPSSPETGHLFYDTDDDEFKVADSAGAFHRLLKADGDSMDGALDMGNHGISGVTTFEADSQVTLDPTSGGLADGGTINSNSEIFRGYYDSDGTTSITPAGVDAEFQHVANSDGSSVLDARVQGTDVARFESNGDLSVPNGGINSYGNVRVEGINPPQFIANSTNTTADRRTFSAEKNGTEQWTWMHDVSSGDSFTLADSTNNFADVISAKIGGNVAFPNGDLTDGTNTIWDSTNSYVPASSVEDIWVYEGGDTMSGTLTANGTLTIDASGGSRMALPSVTADPTANAGDIWYRSDLD